MNTALLPCPFCGGEDIRYSLKTKGTSNRQYHAVMYCNTCHCYGKRTLTEKIRWDDYPGRRKIQEDEDIKRGAITAWNTRVTRPKPDTVAISRGDLEKVMVALHDATAGYRYIEANHPTLYGVGYHRCIHNGKEALSILEAALGEKK